jgi:S1-C subfamily serine protease
MRTTLLATLFPILLVAARAQAATPPAGPFCTGAYADELTTLSADAQTFDRSPDGVFSYCTRNTAMYECLSYARDGSVRHDRRKAVLHGTAFAYKKQGNDTFLLTNDHVAAWPAVTDAQHVVDGIPAGCKKVSEALALVDDEHDSYARDDALVTRVVTDPQLDVAILKTQAALHVMPWKVGRSAALRERNAVEVRGFPLGAFRATNVGKVISATDHDDYGEWDHDDFVVDALLSSGNSGSPVLAVSCATGEYELVGVFHAGYTGGSAMNVVVGIDQVREMMTTLKRVPRSHREDVVLDGTSRAAVQAALGTTMEMFFPFGPAVALVRGGPDHALYFAVFARDFPFNPEPIFVIEDVPAVAGSFGEPGRIWFGSTRGLKAYERASLDADAQQQAARTLEALRGDAFNHAAYRSANMSDLGSRQASDRVSKMSAALTRTATTRGDVFQAIADLADKLAPLTGERGTTLSAIAYAPPPAPHPN